MEATSIACIGATKPGTGAIGILPETLETPIDWRRTVGRGESKVMVPVFRLTVFFALITSVFDGGSLDTLVNAAESFALAIRQQIAAVQGITTPTELAEKTIFTRLRRRPITRHWERGAWIDSYVSSLRWDAAR
jgi:hypothetical protein